MKRRLSPREGEWIEPNQTLVRIVQTDRLQVEGFAPIKLARKLQVGMPVVVHFKEDWIEQPVAGKILFINPDANPNNLNLQVRVEVENKDGKLVPGMRGDVVVTTK